MWTAHKSSKETKADAAYDVEEQTTLKAGYSNVEFKQSARGSNATIQ